MYDRLFFGLTLAVGKRRQADADEIALRLHLVRSLYLSVKRLLTAFILGRLGDFQSQRLVLLAFNTLLRLRRAQFHICIAARVKVLVLNHFIISMDARRVQTIETAWQDGRVTHLAPHIVWMDVHETFASIIILAQFGSVHDIPYKTIRRAQLMRYFVIGRILTIAAQRYPS